MFYRKFRKSTRKILKRRNWEIVPKSLSDSFGLQNWFIKATCYKKAKLIIALIKSLEPNPIQDIMITKDKFTNNFNSIITKFSKWASFINISFYFDGRFNNDGFFKMIMNDDFVWFKILDGNKQYQIIVDLIRLGGISLKNITSLEAVDFVNIVNYFKSILLQGKFEGRDEIEDCLRRSLKNATYYMKFNFHQKPLEELPKKVNKFEKNSNVTDSLDCLPFSNNSCSIDLKFKKNIKNCLECCSYLLEKDRIEEKFSENIIKIISALYSKRVAKKGLSMKNSRAQRDIKSRKDLTSGSAVTSLGHVAGTEYIIKNVSLLSLIKILPPNRVPFLNKFNKVKIKLPFIYERAIDCTRKWIAAAENSFVVLYNMHTDCKSTFKLFTHSVGVSCLAFFPNSFRIATGCLDGTCKTWDLWNRQLIATFQGATSAILTICVNENYLASCSKMNIVRLYSQTNRLQLLQINTFKTFTPTVIKIYLNNQFYIGTKEGNLGKLSIDKPSNHSRINYAHKSCIYSIGLCKNILYSAGLDSYVRIWNSDFKCKNFLAQFYCEQTVNSVEICCSTLISACEDGKLRFWHLATGKLIRKININLPGLPILNIYCQKSCDDIKIICNNVNSLQILQFDLNSPIVKKSHNKKKDSPYNRKDLFKKKKLLKELSEKKLLAEASELIDCQTDWEYPKRSNPFVYSCVLLDERRNRGFAPDSNIEDSTVLRRNRNIEREFALAQNDLNDILMYL